MVSWSHVQSTQRVDLQATLPLSSVVPSLPQADTPRLARETRLAESGTWRRKRQRFVLVVTIRQTRILTLQWTLSGHKGWVLCVEWDAREKVLATGGHDGQVSLFHPTQAS